jgi:putative addiction module component (TIGR02574 family)
LGSGRLEPPGRRRRDQAISSQPRRGGQALAWGSPGPQIGNRPRRCRCACRLAPDIGVSRGTTLGDRTGNLDRGAVRARAGGDRQAAAYRLISAWSRPSSCASFELEGENESGPGMLNSFPICVICVICGFLLSLWLPRAASSVLGSEPRVGQDWGTVLQNTSESTMDTRKSDLEQQVLRLSATQRARLARVLLESLDEETEEDVEAAWAAEAKRRSEELRSGRVQGRTSAQVHARARAALSALR